MKFRFYKYKILLFAVVGITILTISCKSTQKAVDTKDLSYLYNPVKNQINPRYNIINETSDRSVLTVKFFTTDLFFSEANPEGVPKAQLFISVRLFNVSQGRVLADTANYNIEIIKEGARPEYLYKVPMKVESGSDYLAEVKIADRIRLMTVQAFVPFNTLSENNQYNFVARGHFAKNELLTPILRKDEYVNLLYLRKPLDSIYVSFYKPFTLIPDPPSMLLPERTIDYDPDTIVALPYSDTMPVMFPREGIYFLTTGKDVKEGYTFFNFGNTFPAMNTPEEMIKPLAYLATADEINAMLSHQRPKIALDDFWVKCGGNVDKARELIRIYYTRVLYSNQYFTSYKEGWRSERGMIYIIYGPPDKVYKTSDGESWGYLKPVVKSSWGGRVHLKEEYLFFNFGRKDSRFTDNDYYLRRSESLVTLWDQAILNWRKGIVFRLDNPGDI
jgi:GWxTD domain-containing protein